MYNKKTCNREACVWLECGWRRTIKNLYLTCIPFLYPFIDIYTYVCPSPVRRRWKWEIKFKITKKKSIAISILQGQKSRVRGPLFRGLILERKENVRLITGKLPDYPVYLIMVRLLSRPSLILSTFAR